MPSDWIIKALTALVVLATFLVSGCAGPTTPLGAPWATSSAETRNGPLSFIASLFHTEGTQIRFEPEHQVLHGPSPLTVHISDPQGIHSNYQLIVRHNGLDVTASFLRQATVEVGTNELTIKVPLVRLPADRDNLIEFLYGNAGQAHSLNAYARYQPPICRVSDRKIVFTTDGFNPDAGLLEVMRRVSLGKGINPALTAGLVAQESGFNPRTVSWAKAIGLTQITPAAEDEVVSSFSDWPRYPGINELPAVFVKALVVSGHVNPTNEWRLDSERSIFGGLTYAQILLERWTQPEYSSRIRTTFEDPDQALTQLVLASYNSGFTRVLSAFNRMGANWLAAPELKEARKYVNRISSYCDHFSDEWRLGRGLASPTRAPAGAKDHLKEGSSHEDQT